MQLPEYAHVRFRRNPLRLVVGQVRFPLLPRFHDRAFLTPFLETLRGEYPSLTEEKQVTLEIASGGLASRRTDSLWRLAKRDKSWAVTLGETALTLEARNYSSVDEFISRFRRVLAFGCEVLDLSERTRVGFRYINEFRSPQATTLADWRALLRPEFLGFAATDLLGGRVENTLHEINLQRSDGTLTIRHGLLTGTILAPLPGEDAPVGRFYLLDLDYHEDKEAALDQSGVLAQMRQYNDVMSRFFRWTLSERLYVEMEPVHGHQGD